jgi:hypothetical protein
MSLFMPELNPYGLARRDAERVLKRLCHRLVDFAKTYVTWSLVKQLGLTCIALFAAASKLPVFAFAVIALALLAAAVHSIYATKLLKAQDRDERWTYVAGKRVQQQTLDMKIAMDTVTLALMGERHPPGMMRGASPELKAALSYHQHRLALAEQRADAAEAMNDGTASDTQRRTLKRLQRRAETAAPPKGPPVEPIRARREALVFERAEREAEIKSLATADDIAKAMKAQEVEGLRRTRRERQDAARKADQAARDRVRAGKTPTRREPERVITLRESINGEHQVGTGRGQVTPEQIAQGEDAA